MPKDTFHNLSPTKKQRIMDAAVHLILNGPIEDISISDVVKHATIPRGSFYQYFESLEDLLRWVYDSFIERFETYKMAQIKEGPQAVFEMFDDSFEKDYLFFTTSDFHKVYAKLLHEKKFVGLDLMAHEKARMRFIQKVLTEVDTKTIRHLSDDEQTDFYILYLRMKNLELHRVIAGTKTYEDAYNTFKFFLRILKKGVTA